MKRLLILLIGAIALIFVRCTLSAEQLDDTNNLVELQDYLQYAVFNNASLKSAFEQWKASEEQVPQAASLPDPQLSYGYATESTPQRKMFDVMQMFPWFGTLEVRTDVASAMANSAQQQYEAKKLELFYEVKQAFYEYSYLAKAVEITTENLELLRHFEEVARVRYAASVTTHPDVIRAQIELAKLEDELKSLEKQRPALVARLNSILNRPPSSDLPWPHRPQYEEVSVDYQKLFTLIKQNNPQLKTVNYNIEAAAGGEKLAQKRFYPDIGIGIGVDSGMGENGSDRVMAKVFLTLPIWRDNYKAAERQAQAQLRQAAYERIQLENTFTDRAQQILYEFEDTGRKIRLYNDVIIPKTKEMLIASDTAYQTGVIDFLSLIDAQRTLLEYQLYYERSVTENAQKLAELEMLAGTQFSAIDK